MGETNSSRRPLSRRAVLSGSVALGGATWITPSVIGIDRIAAAVGSCGTPPVQLDWTTLSGTYPTTATAADGTVITITLLDPFGVADPAFQGRVWPGTLNTLDNPLLMAMENAINGAGTTIRFEFSKPVAVCFNLADVDAAVGGWEDTIEITGSNAGVPVALTATDFVTGTDNTFLATNTVRGLNPTSTASGNVEVSFPAAIDRLEIEHRDDSTRPGFQFIGIHDFSWC